MSHLIRTHKTDVNSSGDDVAILVRPKTQLKKPSLYKVILMNDDYTPMDFVVYILEQFFNKTSQEAVQIMLTIHNKGSAVCGVFTYEIAEAKVVAVLECAFAHGHPLECTIEKE